MSDEPVLGFELVLVVLLTLLGMFAAEGDWLPLALVASLLAGLAIIFWTCIGASKLMKWTCIGASKLMKGTVNMLPLGFYRKVFPGLYQEAVSEVRARRQRELDEANWKWVMGPDPFTKLPRDLRGDFDLDVLLGGDEVKAAHEQEINIEADIDEQRERMAAAMRVPPHQLGPSSQEIMESVERGPGCPYCAGTGIVGDMWSGARSCDYCTTGVAERVHQERARITSDGELHIHPMDLPHPVEVMPSPLEGAKLIALNMALNCTPYDETHKYIAQRFSNLDIDSVVNEAYRKAEQPTPATARAAFKPPGGRFD